MIHRARPLAELRDQVSRGLLTFPDVPVLLVGFADAAVAPKEFRTQTTVPRGVPPSLGVALQDAATQVVPLVKGGKNPYDGFIFVGRAPTSDVVLRDPSVSKSHGAFERVGERWFLRDNNSHNGTWVNARRLGAGEKVPLDGSAQVSFGAVATYFLSPPELERRVRAG